MRRIQLFRLGFVLLTVIGLMMGWHVLATNTEAAQAPPAVEKQLDAPHVTVTEPQAYTLITETPQIVELTYDCGSTMCLGSFLIDVVSVTVAGESGPYYAASPVEITDTGGLYSYTWALEAEDYVTHVVMGRARDVAGRIGTSEPVTVYVDNQAPATAMLTLPTYTENLTFPVAWHAEDGSGEVRYTLQYRRDDQMTWVDWMTRTENVSAVFTVTQQAVQAGHTYDFRMQAYDKGHNASNWITESIRVGKWRLYLPVVVRNYPPVWRRGAGSAGMEFRAPIGCGESIWYAGTGGTDGVWRSTDNARNWDKIADLWPEAYPVVVDPDNCAEAFVSVWGSGIFRLSGTLFVSITENLGEPYVYGLTLKDNYLYAGTSNQGIYKTNIQDIDWQSVNTGIVDQRIRSLANIDGALYAGSRNCSFYVSYSDGEGWDKYTVLEEAACEDEQVWSIAAIEGTLYAGLGGGRGLYYLDRGAWKQAPAPVPGDKTIRGLAYDGVENLYVSAYEGGVYRCEVDDTGLMTACYDISRGLGSLSVREIRLHNDLLVVGSDDGVWYLPLSP
jgi:hypothetical protein